MFRCVRKYYLFLISILASGRDGGELAAIFCSLGRNAPHHGKWNVIAPNKYLAQFAFLHLT